RSGPSTDAASRRFLGERLHGLADLLPSRRGKPRVEELRLERLLLRLHLAEDGVAEGGLGRPHRAAVLVRELLRPGEAGRLEPFGVAHLVDEPDRARLLVGEVLA